MPIQFSFYNRSDAATLSAGSWLAGAPLANLQQLFLSLRARSSNALAASTQFRIDLASTGTVVRLVALARHNLSIDATYRVTAGTTAGASDVYDTGWQLIWPAVYLPEDLEWEDDNWWTGQLSADEIEGYPNSGMLNLITTYTARYWTIEFDDTTNAAGYVEIAHLRMGQVWQPERNYALGAQFGWEDRTVSEYSLGGVIYSDTRPPARVLRLSLKGLTRGEAFGALLDAQRLLGTHTPFWVMPAPDDAARGFKRNFLARFRKVDPITQAFHSVHETTLELEEWL